MAHRGTNQRRPQDWPHGLDPRSRHPARLRPRRPRSTFYRDKVGFHLDHHTTNEFMDVAQLTPRGLGLLDRHRQPPLPAGDGAGLDARAAARRRRRRMPPARSSSGRGIECSEMTVFDERDGGTLLRVRRPGRQHLGGAAAQGPRREAADPARPPRSLRRRRTSHLVPLPTSTPSAQGVDARGILALVDALESDGHDPHSLLVARHGHVIARGWWAPYCPRARPARLLTEQVVHRHGGRAARRRGTGLAGRAGARPAARPATCPPGSTSRTATGGSRSATA